MALSESKDFYTPQKEARMMLEVPEDLSSKKSVETPAGTWHMAGGVAIFDTNVHGTAKRDSSQVPHVKDINAYTSAILEAEMNKAEVNQKEQNISHARRPLSVRRIASLFPTILG